jgi:tRNA-splicing ligase RtcB
MSRAEAKRRFTLDDHARATGALVSEGRNVMGETPMAYKSIGRDASAARSGGCGAQAA